MGGQPKKAGAPTYNYSQLLKFGAKGFPKEELILQGADGKPIGVIGARYKDPEPSRRNAKKVGKKAAKKKSEPKLLSEAELRNRIGTEVKAVPTRILAKEFVKSVDPTLLALGTEHGMFSPEGTLAIRDAMSHKIKKVSKAKKSSKKATSKKVTTKKVAKVSAKKAATKKVAAKKVTKKSATKKAAAKKAAAKKTAKAGSSMSAAKKTAVARAGQGKAEAPTHAGETSSTSSPSASKSW